MQEWLLYCMNRQGRVSSTERLAPMSKAELRDVAQARLAACHSLEVWDGAICILRLHREPKDGDPPQAD